MKNKLLTSSLLLLSIISVFAQTEIKHNEKSKALLEKVSEAYQKNNTTKFTFKLTIVSEDINETQEGFALVKDDKFYYKTQEREVISDGETVWTYIAEDNECYIDLLDDLENSINPNEIFTPYVRA